MKKLLTIVGARPQFIKAAVLSRALLEHGNAFREIIVHTGQHFDKNMSAVFFDEMEIPKPDFNLNVNSLSHGAMTGKMLEGIEQIILQEQPRCVIVYGDTNSTIAGALAAKKLHIPVAHVEAGLRSFNMNMPEEVNRILTDRISDLLYCPTQKAVANLEAEGFGHFPCRIEQVGDVMQDAALFYRERSAKTSGIIAALGLSEKPYLLVTIHRAENTDDHERLRSIVDGLNKLSRKYEVILPLHPRTKSSLARHGLALDFTPINPVGYLDMIQLLSNARLVITDSGGVQKEAYFFRRPCITVRDQTEWTELVEAGNNTLLTPTEEDLVSLVESKLGQTFNPNEVLYGGGKAGERIVASLLNFLN
jgi:UDP-GlcNAc3NAcA epimerase